MEVDGRHGMMLDEGKKWGKSNVSGDGKSICEKVVSAVKVGSNVNDLKGCGGWPKAATRGL